MFRFKDVATNADNGTDPIQFDNEQGTVHKHISMLQNSSDDEVLPMISDSSQESETDTDLDSPIGSDGEAQGEVKPFISVYCKIRGGNVETV